MKRIVTIEKMIYDGRVKEVYEFRLNVSKHAVVVDIYYNRRPFQFTRWTNCI